MPMSRSVTALCAGSFDPVTQGHVDIICRATALFDKVVVAVLVNSQKKPCFTIEERLNFLRLALQDFPQVEIVAYHGMAAELAAELGDAVLVKGVRNEADLYLEQTEAEYNRRLGNAETILLPCKTELTHVSSSAVKVLISYQLPAQAYKGLLPPEIIEQVIACYKGGFARIDPQSIKEENSHG